MDNCYLLKSRHHGDGYVYMLFKCRGQIISPFLTLKVLNTQSFGKELDSFKGEKYIKLVSLLIWIQQVIKQNFFCYRRTRTVEVINHVKHSSFYIGVVDTKLFPYWLWSWITHLVSAVAWVLLFYSINKKSCYTVSWQLNYIMFPENNSVKQAIRCLVALKVRLWFHQGCFSHLHLGVWAPVTLVMVKVH